MIKNSIETAITKAGKQFSCPNENLPKVEKEKGTDRVRCNGVSDDPTCFTCEVKYRGYTVQNL